MSTEIDAAKCQRVAERIGVWKPGQICRNGGEIVNWKDENGRAKCPVCQNVIFNRQGYHDIPPPDLPSPAMVVAMIEWLLSHEGHVLFTRYQWSWAGVTVQGRSGATLAAALIDAIDKLPEEK